MKDRIKLAEAMGWTDIRMKHVEMDGNSYPFGWSHESDNPKYREQIPDPFTNANDDYAVLEWMNNHRFSKRRKFSAALAHELQKIEEDGSLKVAWPDAAMRYRIGDYARAALKVIE